MTVLLHAMPWPTGYGRAVALAAACMGLLGLVLLLREILFGVRYPRELPLAGEPPGRRWFSPRTRWRYYTDCAALYREAYAQSSMRRVLSAPEDRLSHAEATLELVQLKVALGDVRYKTDPWPGMLVKTEVNAALEDVCVDLEGDLKCAIDDLFIVGTVGYSDVELLPAIRRIVAQAASRFTVGPELCRNQEYLTDCLAFIDGMVMNGGISGALPPLLRPVFSPVVTWKLRRSINRIRHHIRKLHGNRSEEPERVETHVYVQSKTQTLFQRMIKFAAERRPGEVDDLDVITRRLCFANFASMHQTGILFTNVLLNIIGSDSQYCTVSVLRDEISRVMGPVEHRKGLTKRQAARLVKLDSVARETLRLHSYTNRGTFRKVVGEGFETEDNIKLPKGSYLSFFHHPLQVDADVFEDPLEYNPFRFSRSRTETGSQSTSFVSTSPGHLAFGYGSHSCPGRFLVDLELKMMLIHVLENYDLELPPQYLGCRPPNKWLAEACVPAPEAKIRVRRRHRR